MAISSRTRTSAERRAREAGLDVPCLDDYEAALRVPGVDIVSVCTPQHLHAEHVIRAARAGKHIAIEKRLSRPAARVCLNPGSFRRAHDQGWAPRVSCPGKGLPIFATGHGGNSRNRRVRGLTARGDSLYYVRVATQACRDAGHTGQPRLEL